MRLEDCASYDDLDTYFSEVGITKLCDKIVALQEFMKHSVTYVCFDEEEEKDFYDIEAQIFLSRDVNKA
jgi:hypothetical protein